MSVLDALLDSPVREAFGSSMPSPNAARDAQRNLSPAQRKRSTAARPASTGSGRFDESKHPRGAAGSAAGGKFVASGSSGAEVRAVQQRVGAKADGKYGSKTAQAVRDFQRRHRLVVDGVVGRQTALALAGQFSKARASATGALTDGQRASLAGKPARKVKGRAPTRARGGVVV